jgi:hypothetical protein
VGGALGMELVGGKYVSLYGAQNLGFAMITTVEEVGEMLGIVIFIYALMSYISAYMKEITVYVREEERPFTPEQKGRV